MVFEFFILVVYFKFKILICGIRDLYDYNFLFIYFLVLHTIQGIFHCFEL